MPSTRGLLLGRPPFKFLAGHLAQDEEFLRDAQRILELTPEAFDRLATELNRANAFLDREALLDIVNSVFGAGDESRDIVSLINRAGGMLHDADMPAAEAMDELGKALQEKATSIPEEDRRILIARLRTLVAEPLGLAKQYKARQLVDATGLELDHFRIICDIRPIFDEGRERVEGAIPLTLLRLEYSRPDGEESGVLEVRLDEKKLKELETALTRTKQKLKGTKDLLKEVGLAIPRTKATIWEKE
jgi:hypothetical protein